MSRLRTWFGDAIVVLLLGGPFIVGPLLLSFGASDSERALLMGLGLGCLGLASLVISTWRRKLTWHLACVPAVSAALLAMGANISTVFHGEGVTEAARTLAQALTFKANSWAAMGVVLSFVFSGTAAICAFSAREGRPGGGGGRLLALVVVLLGGAIPAIEQLTLKPPLTSLGQSTWGVGVAALFAGFAIVIAGGAHVDRRDETGRDRVMLASMYGIASVFSAVVARSLWNLGDFDIVSGKWFDLAASANDLLGKSRWLFWMSSLFLIPVVLAALLVAHPKYIWKSATRRFAVYAIAAPVALLVVGLVQARRTCGKLAAIDLPIPDGFALAQAPSRVACDFEPNEVVYVNDRVRVGPDDLGASSELLDVPSRCEETGRRLTDRKVKAFALADSVPFERAVCFTEALYGASCTLTWLVRDHGRAGCLELRRSSHCDGGDMFDVTLGDGGTIDFARTTQIGVLATAPKRMPSAGTLESTVRDIVGRGDDPIPDDALRSVTIRAPAAMPVRDVMGVVAALTQSTREVTLEGSSGPAKTRIEPRLKLELTALIPRTDPVDDRALKVPVADGLALCRKNPCGLATWKALSLADALAHQTGGQRDLAIRSAFLLLSMDSNALDGTPLEAVVVTEAKKLQRPSVVLSLAEEAPDTVRRVVETNEGNIHRCVAELELRRTLRPDEWRFEFTIDATGVVAAFSGREHISRGEAHDCLENAFRAMRFDPQPKPITVHYLVTIGESVSPLSPPPLIKQPDRITMKLGEYSVAGALPPDTVARIIRQGFGRFKLCYERGLENNPTLEGRVMTKIIINELGGVESSEDAGSNLPDSKVVSCVIAGSKKLAFPRPGNGKVTVIFPIAFRASE